MKVALKDEVNSYFGNWDEKTSLTLILTSIMLKYSIIYYILNTVLSIP